MLPATACRVVTSWEILWSGVCVVLLRTTTTIKTTRRSTPIHIIVHSGGETRRYRRRARRPPPQNADMNVDVGLKKPPRLPVTAAVAPGPRAAGIETM